MNRLMGVKHLVSLAVQDMWFDRKVSFCMVASLMAVVAPLLLLFGLKFGVVTQMQAELMAEPRNLEIKMLSGGNYEKAWLEALAAEPSVGFVLGLTRSLNTMADLRTSQGRFIENIEVVPTVHPDPLLPHMLVPLSEHGAIISASAARQLNATLGSEVVLLASRQLNGVRERGEYRLIVEYIAEEKYFSRSAVFVVPPILHSLEFLRDGYYSPEWGVFTGNKVKPAEMRYAKARIYAADLDKVETVVRLLEAKDIQVLSRVADIENVKAINRVLGLIFSVICAAALLGCVASLVGAFLSNIDRKRRSMAVLQLLGFSKLDLCGYIVIQAILMGLLGFAGGGVIYLVGASIFNQVLLQSVSMSTYVCQINFIHAFIALFMVLLITTVVAVIGTFRAVIIEPAECLREI